MVTVKLRRLGFLWMVVLGVLISPWLANALTQTSGRDEAEVRGLIERFYGCLQKKS